jgi:hypothetical protein
MTDFDYDFGDCILRIRDQGYGANVEFWIWAKDQTINYGYLQFETFIDGNRNIFAHAVPYYANWVAVASIPVNTTQYVTFQLDTDLSIFNGGEPHDPYPHVWTVHIARPTVPYPPSAPRISDRTVNSLSVTWGPPPNDGGATVTGYQVGYSTDSSGPSTIVNAISPATLSNLATGTVYYIWVRAGNYQGWSDWSYSVSARTYLGAYVNVGGSWKLAIPYVRNSGSWYQAEPIVHTS